MARARGRADLPSLNAPVTSSWCREQQDGPHLALVLELHVQPGARRTEVAGLHGGALKLRLAAPAVEGKANAELLRFVAEAFDVPRRQVTLLQGETARHKRLRVDGPKKRPDRAWGAHDA